jgi:DNA-3-methyladenine glycosylase II
MSGAPIGKPHYWDQACSELAAADPVMARLIGTLGASHLVARGDSFVTLARAIVGQQISVKAAQSVWDRFVTAAREVHPERVARMRASTLRRCGLSQRKAEYVRDLARRFAGGDIDPLALPQLDDEQVIGQLVEVRGVGRWTAEMFLIFNLLRPDVFPVDDLGLLRAIARHYRDGAEVSRGEALAIGESWRPWRSVATWIMWRSLDPVPVEY